MSELKTKPTKVSVKSFIAAVPNETRRKDAESLLKLFAKVTGWKPKMWGPTIVGFGSYKYTYDSGHSGESCVCGFSPRTANLVIYSGAMAKDHRESLLNKLGKYKTKGGCIYINKLADIDEKVLARLIESGVANMKKLWPVSGT
jgi:Domain of unknown function (DU1801)